MLYKTLNELKTGDRLKSVKTGVVVKFEDWKNGTQYHFHGTTVGADGQLDAQPVSGWITSEFNKA